MPSVLKSILIFQTLTPMEKPSFQPLLFLYEHYIRRRFGQRERKWPAYFSRQNWGFDLAEWSVLKKRFARIVLFLLFQHHIVVPSTLDNIMEGQLSQSIDL